MDVLKTLENKNRLHAPLLAPSHYQKLDQKYADLSTDDKKLFFEVLDHPVALNDASSKHLLDALVEYLSFERYRNSGEIPERYKGLERASFLARAKKGQGDSETEIKKPPPHESHDSMMLQSGVRRSQSLEWTLGYRFTVHGLADPSGGYLENSSVELFSPLLAVRQEKGAYKLRLLDLVLGQMENFQPYRLFSPQGSWRLLLGAREEDDRSKTLQKFFEGGYGIAFGREKSLAYLLTLAELDFPKNSQAFFAGLESGAIFNKERIKLLARARIFRALSATQWKAEGALSFGLSASRNSSLQLNAKTKCLIQTSKHCWNVGEFELRYYF